MLLYRKSVAFVTTSHISRRNMTTTTDVRLVPETFGRFRYLNVEELTQGTTALMVDIDTETDRINADRFATRITIDPNPLYNRHDDTPGVYYHCTLPAWDGQCYVPVATMTTGHADRDDWPSAGPRYEYWVATRP